LDGEVHHLLLMWKIFRDWTVVAVVVMDHSLEEMIEKLLIVLDEI
jgi:hypothetical protein